MRLRTYSAVLLLLLLGGAAPDLAAESLPETGTFEGVYHKDRWGHAKVSFFVIPKRLQPRFAPFEGQRIRFEVTRGVQEINPGPVLVKAVGTIERVTAGPKLTVDIARRKGAPADEWLVVLTNRGAQAARVGSRYLRLRYWREKKRHGASRASLGRTDARPGWGRRDPTGVPFVTLSPGASFAFPFRLTLEGGDAELEASYLHWDQPDASRCRYAKWVRPENGVTELEGGGLRLKDARAAPWSELLKSPSRRDDGSYVLQGRLVPAAGAPRLPVLRQGVHVYLAARVRAFDWAGRPIALTSGLLRDGHLWNLDYSDRRRGHTVERVPDEGMAILMHFAPKTRFQDWAIERLQLEVLSDGGTLIVPVDLAFRDTLRVKPPAWGPPHEGVRIRARTLDQGPKRPVDVLIEARNDAGTPRMLTLGEHGGTVAFLIDGKLVRPEPRRLIYGWAVKRTCRERKVLRLSLRRDVILPAGEHTLQVMIEGPGGTHRNTNGVLIPVLGGLLKSAATTFHVR